MVSNIDAWGHLIFSSLIPLVATFSDLPTILAMVAAVMEISVPPLMCFSQVPLL